MRTILPCSLHGDHSDGVLNQQWHIENPSEAERVLWLSTQPGVTAIGVRIGERDVTVLSKPGPLYLEDSFPVAKSVIRGSEYVLLDKAGTPLASVALKGPSAE